MPLRSLCAQNWVFRVEPDMMTMTELIANPERTAQAQRSACGRREILMIKTNDAPMVPHVSEGLTRWNPFDEFGELRHRFDDLFARAFGYTPLSRLIPNETMTFEPVIDMYETEKNVDLYVSLPGFKPEMINVNVTPNYVAVEGERKVFCEEKAVVRRQGWVSSACNFSVTYTLPVEVIPKEVKAIFENGILHLILPKTVKAIETNVKVPVKTA